MGGKEAEQREWWLLKMDKVIRQKDKGRVQEGQNGDYIMKPHSGGHILQSGSGSNNSTSG